MDKNRIQDRAASVAGDIESGVGALAGDAKAQMEGLASQATATAERAYGEARHQMRGALEIGEFAKIEIRRRRLLDGERAAGDQGYLHTGPK